MSKLNSDVQHAELLLSFLWFPQLKTLNMSVFMINTGSSTFSEVTAPRQNFSNSD